MKQSLLLLSLALALVLALAARLSAQQNSSVVSTPHALPSGGTTAGPALRAFRDGELVVSVQALPGMPISYVSDWVTGRLGAMMPVAGDTFQLTFIDNGSRQPSPEYLWFTTDRTGSSALMIREAGQADRLLPEIPLVTEEVTWRHGDVTLTGLLVSPKGTSPRPAVVFLHGSGDATRGTFPSYAGLFASRGIASLSYDKRGTGGSTGNWQTSTLEELAGDAREGIALLRTRSNIDPARIGTLGTSQGPWLSALLLAADPTLAFSIATSGGGVSGGDQEIYRRVRLVADSGFPPAEVAGAKEYITAYFEYLKSGGSDSVRFRPIFQRYANAGWLGLISPVKDPTVGDWPPARKVFAKDLALPLPELYAKIHQPMLALYGNDDKAVPTSVAIEHLQRELPGGTTGQLTTKMLTEANHQFLLPATAGDIPRLHPAYIRTIITWLTQVVDPARPTR
ncbi:MAG: alpha/beta hydrolase [Gemmatimonadota bacterium]